MVSGITGEFFDFSSSIKSHRPRFAPKKQLCFTRWGGRFHVGPAPARVPRVRCQGPVEVGYLWNIHAYANHVMVRFKEKTSMLCEYIYIQYIRCRSSHAILLATTHEWLVFADISENIPSPSKPRCCELW